MLTSPPRLVARTSVRRLPTTRPHIALAACGLLALSACATGLVDPMPAGHDPAAAHELVDDPTSHESAPGDASSTGDAGASRDAREAEDAPMQTDCERCGGSACVDLTTSSDHCGACGVVCAAGESCMEGSCACAGPEVDFAADVAPLLEQRCAACHWGALPRAGLDLTASASYDELVGVRATQCGDGRALVDPGNPSTSYLVHKLLGTDLCSGTVMPKAVRLPTAELEIITSWICRGAPR